MIKRLFTVIFYPVGITLLILGMLLLICEVLIISPMYWIITGKDYMLLFKTPYSFYYCNFIVYKFNMELNA